MLGLIFDKLELAVWTRPKPERQERCKAPPESDNHFREPPAELNKQ